MPSVYAYMITTAMPRCVYLHDAGVQCISETVAGSDFCEDHQPDTGVFPEPDNEHPLRRLVLRLVALILLLMMLVPFYEIVSTLYVSPFYEAVEAP